MKTWTNFIAFQIVWFAAVLGAAHGYWWAGPVALAGFLTYHLRAGVRKKGDFKLMAIALCLGFATDTLMAASGLSSYASPIPAAPLAPFWILSLWAGFALTLNHSMSWFTARTPVAAPLAAIFGPVSYYGAGRAWGAVQITEPVALPLIVLGTCWLIAMSVLSIAARRFSLANDNSDPQILQRSS
ncbi:DUF2878 domain-containing protein [Dokdonella sp.]|uniref:DUF2878 domain-containing protein n=1 Tax=Dokdonella sp. TaxID=2291710 RepID=UPI003C647A59